MIELIIHHIGELITPFHTPPVKGKFMREVKRVTDAFIAINDGLIVAIGSGDYQAYQDKNTVLYDASGALMVPGFIDGHTHLVFGGSREFEFADKVAGIPYLDILKRGGGIFATVKSTRQATMRELETKALKSLDIMLSFGVTTIEAKSGYGLDQKTEIRQLEVASAVNKIQPIDIISTYMGAHAIPKEYAHNRTLYIEEVIKIMKTIKASNLAVFADVFCEEGVFTPQETIAILTAAKAIGLIPKVHADEIVSNGGAKIAVDLQAASADHLMAISTEDMVWLAQSNTIANLLPGTSFYLNKEYANARALLEVGAAVGVASDYNPGSSPSENFQLIMQLAANKLRMSPEEILNAVTINPAYQLHIADKVGSIAIGKQADLVLLDAKNLEYVMYHYGINHTKAVFKNGVLVYEAKHYNHGGII
ncbi:MAG: imidazolonepropionase [Candidatus Izemoplasmatales bacterium]|jgi:imidazolonepropionase